MIQEIFLPEKTKTRRLISKRIIGMTIQENIVTAAQIYATPSTTLVEKLYEEQIPAGAPERKAERTGETITKVLARMSKYDQIRVAIPSTIVTFKELTLPFTDNEKIRMVIEYEVEPKLAFSIDEAIIDFIVTKQIPEEDSSQVLVAAVRKQDLQSIFDAYQIAEIDLSCITVDLFALYGLYLQIPDYANLPQASALIDIGTNNTTIAFLLNGELRLIRSIGKGIGTIAKHITQETKQSPDEVEQKLLNIGTQQTQNETYNQSVQKQITHFLNDIQFTLNSFSLKLNFYDEISKILFVGKDSYIKGFADFAGTVLQIPCEHFSSNKLFKTKQFQNKTPRESNSWANFSIALGTAIAYAAHDEFNLQAKEFAPKKHPLAIKQLFTAGILLCIVFATIGICGFLQINTLQTKVMHQERQAIVKLKKIFPPGSSALKKTRLKTLTKQAEQELARRQEAWMPFLYENLKPLEILHDLTQTMYHRLFAVTINTILISTEEKGIPQVEISGIFKAKEGELWESFNNFTKFFEENSTMLTLSPEPDVNLSQEGAIEFTFKLKQKEKPQS